MMHHLVEASIGSLLPNPFLDFDIYPTPDLPPCRTQHLPGRLGHAPLSVEIGLLTFLGVPFIGLAAFGVFCLFSARSWPRRLLHLGVIVGSVAAVLTFWWWAVFGDPRAGWGLCDFDFGLDRLPQGTAEQQYAQASQPQSLRNSDDN